MLRVWGRATSGNVQKVMWAIGELGLAYERIDAGREFGGLDDRDVWRAEPEPPHPDARGRRRRRLGIQRDRTLPRRRSSAPEPSGRPIPGRERSRTSGWTGSRRRSSRDMRTVFWALDPRQPSGRTIRRRSTRPSSQPEGDLGAPRSPPAQPALRRRRRAHHGRHPGRRHCAIATTRSASSARPLPNLRGLVRAAAGARGLPGARDAPARVARRGDGGIGKPEARAAVHDPRRVHELLRATGVVVEQRMLRAGTIVHAVEGARCRFHRVVATSPTVTGQSRPQPGTNRPVRDA